MERKKSGRMTDIPQLGPEVYVDDESDIIKQQSTTATSPLLSPLDINAPRNSFITHGLDGSISVPLSPGSPRVSPQLSPHRPTNSAISLDGGEQLSGGGGGSNQSSRRGSAVSAENVLEVLDNSAWGESIRRSFTMRRPSRGASS